MYATFYAGTSAEYAKSDSSDTSVTIQKGLVGTLCAVVTTNGPMSPDTNTVASVAVLDFSFDSNFA